MLPMHDLKKSLPSVPAEVSRWTLNALPKSEAVTKALTDYSDNPAFDDYLAGYRAGNGHGTKTYSYPHATSVHFAATRAQFELVVEFARQWTAEHPEPIRAGLKNPEITEPVTIPISEAAKDTYTTLSAKPTCWKDINLEQAPFMPFHMALVVYIEEELALKVINGNRAGHRPHYTGGRFDAEAVESKDVVFPPFKLPLDADGKIEHVLTAGPSDLSGEYHNPEYLLQAGEKLAFPKAKVGPISAARLDAWF